MGDEKGGRDRQARHDGQDHGDDRRHEVGQPDELQHVQVEQGRPGNAGVDQAAEQRPGRRRG